MNPKTAAGTGVRLTLFVLFFVSIFSSVENNYDDCQDNNRGKENNML